MPKLLSILGGFAALSVSVSVSAQEPAETRTARVRFESVPEHVALYRSSLKSQAWAVAGTHAAYGSQNDYQRLCVSPCEVALPAGTDTYAVARIRDVEEGSREVGAITLPSGASSVRVEYKDRSAWRTAADVVGWASVGVFGYGLYQLVRITECKDENTRDACIKPKAQTAAISGGVSLLLLITSVRLNVSDDIEIQVRPRQQALDVKLPRAHQMSWHGTF